MRRLQIAIVALIVAVVTAVFVIDRWVTPAAIKNVKVSINPRAGTLLVRAKTTGGRQAVANGFSIDVVNRSGLGSFTLGLGGFIPSLEKFIHSLDKFILGSENEFRSPYKPPRYPPGGGLQLCAYCGLDAPQGVLADL